MEFMVLQLAWCLNKVYYFIDKFRAFAKVASGLTHDELNTLESTIGTYWNSSDFCLAKDAGIFFGSQTPDVWIEPKNSCVLQVIAAVSNKKHAVSLNVLF